MSRGRNREPSRITEKSMVGVEGAQPETIGAKQVQFLQIQASSRHILPGSLAHLRECSRQEGPTELLAFGKGLAEVRGQRRLTVRKVHPTYIVNEKSGVGVRGLVQTKRMEGVGGDWQKTTTKNKSKQNTSLAKLLLALIFSSYIRRLGYTVI